MAVINYVFRVLNLAILYIDIYVVIDEDNGKPVIRFQIDILFDIHSKLDLINPITDGFLSVFLVSGSGGLLVILFKRFYLIKEKKHLLGIRKEVIGIRLCF